MTTFSLDSFYHFLDSKLGKRTLSRYPIPTRLRPTFTVLVLQCRERKANSCGPGYDVLDDVNRYLTLTMNVINNRTRRRYVTKSKKRGEGRGSRKPLHA